MGGSASTANNNSGMIRNLVDEKFIRSLRVERAFRAVDRGLFFPSDMDVRNVAFNDNAWRNGPIHISSPCIYCEAIERLELQPGQSFLNLGSGTGYLSAVAGHLLGANGLNHGVEIYPQLCTYAQTRIDDLMKNSQALDMFEFCVPRFACGNFLLLQTGIQYDRIYCGAACNNSEIEDFLKSLLKIGGKLIVPVLSELKLIERISHDNFTCQTILAVAFSEIMPLQAQDTAPVLPMPKLRSLKSHCRTAIRSAIRRKIYHKSAQLHYGNSILCRVNKNDTGSEKAPSLVSLRMKLDSGIIEDMYDESEEYNNEIEDIDVETYDEDTDDDADNHKEFSTTMRSYIKKLEVPKTLLKFLNFNRDL